MSIFTAIALLVSLTRPIIVAPLTVPNPSDVPIRYQSPVRHGIDCAVARQDVRMSTNAMDKVQR